MEQFHSSTYLLRRSLSKIFVLDKQSWRSGSWSWGSGTFRQPGSGKKTGSGTGSLKEQNIDQNHPKIIPKFSNRRLFVLFNMAIFFSYMICPSSKNPVSSLKVIKNMKTLWNFSIYGQIQAGSGSGAKLSGSDNTGIKQFLNCQVCIDLDISVADPDNFASDPDPARIWLNIEIFQIYFCNFYSLQSWYKICTRRSCYIRREYCHITLLTN